MRHEDLVEALRAIDGLHEVGKSRPIFHFRSQPFLHFHIGNQGTFADVRFGTRGFERVPCATPAERAERAERAELLARVFDHVESIQRTRKTARQSGA